MKKNDILIILIPTFFFVVAWIAFSVYHNIVTSTISGELNMQILPISSNFDTKTIDSLKNRQRVEPVYQIGRTPKNNNQNAPSSQNQTGNASSSVQQATAGGSLIP